MPDWNNERLAEAISNGEIGAVTLDTNTFDKSGCNLKWLPFESLKQFSGTGIKYLVSDVVAGEVQNHVGRRAREAALALRSKLKEFSVAWREPNEALLAQVATALDADTAAFAKADFDAHLARTDGSLLASNGSVAVEELLRKYFAFEPPFENRADKKNEFPDAIALLALEQWGENSRKYVLAITSDGGWTRFAEHSRWVVCAGDLRKALGLFNEQDAFLAKRLAVAINSASSPRLTASFEAAVQRFVDDFYPDVEADSSFQYDVEFEGATLLGYGEIDEAGVSVISSDEARVTVSFDVTVDLEVEAHFGFYMRDEGDSISLGAASVSREAHLSRPVTMIIDRDALAKEDLDAAEIVVEQERWLTLRVGRVDPDYGSHPDD